MNHQDLKSAVARYWPRWCNETTEAAWVIIARKFRMVELSTAIDAIARWFEENLDAKKPEWNQILANMGMKSVDPEKNKFTSYLKMVRENERKRPYPEPDDIARANNMSDEEVFYGAMRGELHRWPAKYHPFHRKRIIQEWIDYLTASGLSVPGWMSGESYVGNRIQHETAMASDVPF